MEGHALHPGVVVKQIVVQGNGVHVVSTGRGDGMLPRLNEWLASPVWDLVDARILNHIDNNYFPRVEDPEYVDPRTRDFRTIYG